MYLSLVFKLSKSASVKLTSYFNLSNSFSLLTIRSDKSLLLDVVYSALGGYAVTSKPQLLTDNKFGSQNSEEIARLNGK